MKNNSSRIKSAEVHALSSLAIATLLAAGAAVVIPAFCAGQQGPQPAAASQQTWAPAGCTKDCDKWVPVKSIDFSSKHDVLIRNSDGTVQPMDQPYHKATLLAPGTWQIESEGDYQYLIEGDNQALAIDSGYGAGNEYEFMQTLTKKPIIGVANTHHHFDHTGDNAYFPRAFMSAYTQKYATVPFKSFEGINFPRNYPVTVVGDGYVFHLGNRDVEVFDIPNHTMGDSAYLDKGSHILFAGDVFMPRITINPRSSVETFAADMRKLAAHRSEIDKIYGGTGLVDATRIDHFLANAEYILAGHEGEPVAAGGQGGPGGPGGPGGQGRQGGPGGPQGGQQAQMAPVPPGATVYTRRRPHAGDHAPDDAPAVPQEDQRVMNYSDCTITYDVRHVKS